MTTLIKKLHKAFGQSLIKDVAESRRDQYQTLMDNQGIFAGRCPEFDKNDHRLLMRIGKNLLDYLEPLSEIVRMTTMSGPVDISKFFTYVTNDAGQISFELIDVSAEASTIRTRAGFDRDQKWTNNEYTVGMADAMASEMACEITDYLVGNMFRLAKKSPAIDVAAMPRQDTFISTYLRQIFLRLNQASNEIARKSRRGTGNFIITSPIGVALLQTGSRDGFEFVPSQTKHKGPLLFSHVGNIKHKNTNFVQWRVYSHISTTQSVDGGEQFLVGYCGRTHMDKAMDGAFAFHPYMVYPMKGFTDPKTLKEHVQLCYRGAIPCNEKLENYFQLVTTHVDDCFKSDEELASPAK